MKFQFPYIQGDEHGVVTLKSELINMGIGLALIGFLFLLAPITIETQTTLGVDPLIMFVSIVCLLMGALLIIMSAIGMIGFAYWRYHYGPNWRAKLGQWYEENGWNEDNGVS